MTKLLRAHESLADLQTKITALRACDSPESFRRYWEEALVHIERSWNRIEAAYGKSARWAGFSGSYVRARRDDQLLAYLKAARDSAEHGLEESTRFKPGHFAINAKDPSKPVCIESLSVNGNEITVGGGSNMAFEVVQPSFSLVQVTNRGVVRNPPAMHGGTRLEVCNIIELLTIAHSYYSKVVERATKFFEGP